MGTGIDHSATARPRVGGSCEQVARWMVDTIDADGREVRDLRVRVTMPPAAVGLVVAQANLVTGGHALRAQAASRSVQVSGPLLLGRLARQVALLAGGHRLRRWPDPMRVPGPVLLVTEAAITRRKQVVLRTLDPDAALVILDARDYDAHLFIDRGTGQDAMVYRADPAGYCLARTRATAPAGGRHAALVTYLRAAPVLTQAAALGRVAASRAPWLFFLDARTGRAALVYARYAGGYGLIEQAP